MSMELNDVVKESKKTWNHSPVERYADDDVELIYLAGCLGGEVGELQNMIKKHFRGKYYSKGHPLQGDIKKFAGTEIADILYYTSRLAELLNVDMEKEFRKKMEENTKRYNVPEAKM